MRTRHRVVIVVFLSLAFIASISSEVASSTKARRDQTLFLAAANAVGEGKQVEARILLKALIYTYPDSPLVGQARILLFYADARDKDQKTDEARRILQEVEEYLNRNHPRPREP